jgi:dolichol-phosphate mannosyltransferase
LLTIDADVRPAPLLVRSLLRHAERTGVRALSVATRQRINGVGLGVLHPAMLTTLVYRFGIPGHATTDLSKVQANGQCFLVHRDLLAETGGFAALLGSLTEDVTLARRIACSGEPVGFYEAGHLVSVEMYASLGDAWANWPRSLPMRDGMTRWSSLAGLAEVLLVQAVPLPGTLIAAAHLGRRHPLTLLNLGLVCARLGVLAGVARAYERRSWSYWLSPLADVPVALRLWQSALRSRHTWRGRSIIRKES